MHWSQSIIKGISKPCPSYLQGASFPFLHLSFKLVGISSGNRVAGEDTSFLLFAKMEDPVTTQDNHGQVLVLLGSTGPLGVKRAFLIQKNLASLVYYELLGRAKAYHEFLGKTLSILLFIS